jgi:hypothetical protein
VAASGLQLRRRAVAAVVVDTVTVGAAMLSLDFNTSEFNKKYSSPVTRKSALAPTTNLQSLVFLSTLLLIALVFDDFLLWFQGIKQIEVIEWSCQVQCLISSI